MNVLGYTTLGTANQTNITTEIVFFLVDKNKSLMSCNLVAGKSASLKNRIFLFPRPFHK